MALVLSACAAPLRVQDPVPVADLVASAPTPEDGYQLRPGDRLDIRFFYNPELNDEAVVRPDGRISLQLVGEQQAAGMTPDQLERTLENAYGRELRNPEVAVIVREFATHRAYVDGEVREPGIVPILGGMSVMQAIAHAGGFEDTARRNEVILIRRIPGRDPQVAVIDMDTALSGSGLSGDIQLQPYDVVYVPRSGVADINLFVDQYIRRNLPIPFSVGYGL